MRKIFSIVLTFAIMTSLITTAFASTQKVEIPVRSCLLIDRSGSIKDQTEVNQKISQYNLEEFDFVGYFDDQQISTDSSYAGGGDSHICETIDAMASRGFQKITVITDGEQYPLGDYSALSLYTDLSINLDLVGDKQEEAEELVTNLSDRLVNSSLRVVDDGKLNVIVDDFRYPTYELDIPEPAPKDEDSETHQPKCYWWVALILAVIFAAIFDFIHELLTRRYRGDLIKKIRKSKVLADFSGSMETYKGLVKRHCRAARYKKPVLVFSGSQAKDVSLAELLSVEANGLTPGWEAVAEAYRQGENNIVVISDLGFNGMSFDEAAGWHFKEITLVVPQGGHDTVTESQMRKITDKVEVICL